ncbi:FxLYD domain-containing protein [Palaeococcus sp. (in: euryarchaeotes)]
MKEKALILVVLAVVIGSIFVSGCTSNTEYTSETTATAKECSLVILNHELKTDGYSYFVEGVAKNNGDKRLSYAEVRVKFYDKDNNVLGNSIDNVLDLDPGQTWKFKIYYFGEGEPVRYEIGVGTCMESS